MASEIQYPEPSAENANESLKKSWKGKDNGYGCREPSTMAVPQGIPRACWYILVVELCERLAFYTFSGSISFFLERVGFSLVEAGGLSTCMMTLCYIWTILSSWVADVACGRYQTILMSGVIYVIGSIIAALGTWPGAENVGLYFFGILFLVPIATAGIKANLSNLGADQYDVTDPDQEAAQERFFYIFYLFINIGSLFSFGFMTTFASNGGLGVPQSYGYLAAYMLAALFMMVATSIFVWGSGRYRKVPLQESSAIYTVSQTLATLARGGSWQAASICTGAALLVGSVLMSLVQAMVPMTGTVKEVMVIGGFGFAAAGLLAVLWPCSDTHWLATGTVAAANVENDPQDFSIFSNSNHKDVKGFLDLLPVLFLGNIAFTSLYNCMAIWYQQQACQMDVRLSPSIQLSGSFFNVADCIAIITVTPLALDWFNPFVEERLKSKFGYGAKFGVGMAFGTASALVAAAMEVSRRGVPVLGVPSQCAPPGVHMSAFSSVWMLLPYFLMGIGEIYCNPTLMHFAYTRSPPSMRTLSAAVSFFIQAVASALFALFLDIVGTFVPNNLNHGHLEYGYLICIAIGGIFFLLFLRALKHP